MTGRTCHIGFRRAILLRASLSARLPPTAVHSVVQRPRVGAGRRVAE